MVEDKTSNIIDCNVPNLKLRFVHRIVKLQKVDDKLKPLFLCTCGTKLGGFYFATPLLCRLILRILLLAPPPTLLCTPLLQILSASATSDSSLHSPSPDSFCRLFLQIRLLAPPPPLLCRLLLQICSADSFSRFFL